ncbi:AraC family transcriptional regulator [Kordiimonas marina]|uniref:AraC family transcriptional regulator n=1 Tax=Kordiimonas marina TaxID=2872312 RepID=UPI001FF342AC|nr:AraC family transcriptional regulator [Kordiimonas marina]MCJ9430618.1 AraC family transcriptional regulator [Kordiimonas marina]
MTQVPESHGRPQGAPRALPTLLETSVYESRPAKTKLNSFDSRAIPEQDQYELWRSVAAASYGTVERDAPHNAPFHAKLDSYLTSSFGYARHTVHHPATMTRDEKAIALGDFDGVAIQYRLAGTELHNTFKCGELIQPGRIRFHDMRRPFSTSYENYDNIALVIHRQQLEERAPGLDHLDGCLFPDSPMTTLLKDHMVTAMKVLEHATKAEAEMLSSVTMEVLTSALLSTKHADILSSETMENALHEAIRFCIDRNLHNPALSPDFIARTVGVSRAKLFRVCQPFGSPMGLVQQHRMRRAKKMIATNPAISITEVAVLVGYENLETFSRAFHRTYDISARDFRQSCRARN